MFVRRQKRSSSGSYDPNRRIDGDLLADPLAVKGAAGRIVTASMGTTLGRLQTDSFISVMHFEQPHIVLPILPGMRTTRFKLSKYGLLSLLLDNNTLVSRRPR
jgi:hypothetical protein